MLQIREQEDPGHQRAHHLEDAPDRGTAGTGQSCIQRQPGQHQGSRTEDQPPVGCRPGVGIEGSHHHAQGHGHRTGRTHRGPVAKHVAQQRHGARCRNEGNQQGGESRSWHGSDDPDKTLTVSLSHRPKKT